MKKIFITMTTLFFTCLCSFNVSAGETIVVVNKAIKVQSFTQKTVTDIYLGNKTKWDGGKKIVIVMLKRGATHDDFTINTLGIAPEKLGRLWKRAYFSGSGNLPKICNSEERLIELVVKYPGAIGYINSDTPHDSVSGHKINK